MKAKCSCWKKIIPFFFILLLIAIPVRGQKPAGPVFTPKHFHLLVFGDDLARGELCISLKTNPGCGEEWLEVEPDHAEFSDGGQFFKLTDLSVAKYFGHDIRENYLPMRISRQGEGSESGEAPAGDANGAKKDGMQIRAVYVVAAGGEASGWSGVQWPERITKDPGGVKALSMASHVRPKPRKMPPGSCWTVHVEAPVRHLKPGVQEVRWLDILFR